jgi:hypothetical protein
VLSTCLVATLLAAADVGAGAVHPQLFPRAAATGGEERGYELRPTPQGGYRYEGPRFSAVIAPDGRVSFGDRASTGRILMLPFLPREQPRATVTLPGGAGNPFGRRGSPPPELNTRSSPPAPPPRTAVGPETWSDRGGQQLYRAYLPAVVLEGEADLTDEYCRRMGDDPLRREKARFLAATFELRVGLAAKSQVRDLRRALHELPDRLERIWGDPSQPAVQRRRVLCALWGELSGDEQGAPAARLIASFVRRRLGRDGPDAYTAAELAACNQGRPANRRFAPYGEPDPDLGD